MSLGGAALLPTERKSGTALGRLEAGRTLFPSLPSQGKPPHLASRETGSFWLLFLPPKKVPPLLLVGTGGWDFTVLLARKMAGSTPRAWGLMQTHLSILPEALLLHNLLETPGGSPRAKAETLNAKKILT